MLGILGSPAPPYIANSQLRQTAGGPCAIVLHSLCSSPTPIPTSGRHQPETALGQIPGAPRSTRPGGSWSPQGPRGRISLRFDRYFPIRSGFPPPWTLLPRQPGSRDSLPPPRVEGHGRLRRGFPSATRSPWASDPERPRSFQRDPAAAWPRSSAGPRFSCLLVCVGKTR